MKIAIDYHGLASGYTTWQSAMRSIREFYINGKQYPVVTLNFVMEAAVFVLGEPG